MYTLIAATSKTKHPHTTNPTGIDLRMRCASGGPRRGRSRMFSAVSRCVPTLVFNHGMGVVASFDAANVQHPAAVVAMDALVELIANKCLVRRLPHQCEATLPSNTHVDDTNVVCLLALGLVLAGAFPPAFVLAALGLLLQRRSVGVITRLSGTSFLDRLRLKVEIVQKI